MFFSLNLSLFGIRTLPPSFASAVPTSQEKGGGYTPCSVSYLISSHNICEEIK